MIEVEGLEISRVPSRRSRTRPSPRAPLATPSPAERLVDGVSLAVVRGEVVGLVGESGAGKSLVAQAILQLLPRGAEQTGGRVRIDGVHVDPRTVHELRGRRVGFVFQGASALNPLLPIGVQIAEAMPAPSPAMVGALLESLGVPAARARDLPGRLSGGQIQRAAIAAAIAGEPRYLIADEPTSALDPGVRAEVIARLAALRDRGLGILLVAHDLEVVEHLCSRVVVLYAGRVVETGDTARVLRAPRHPYTAMLVARAESPGPRAASGCRFAPRCPHADAACAPEPALVDGVRCAHPRGGA